MIVLYTLLVFFFNDTATTEIYTLSLHDALPIFLHMRDSRLESKRFIRTRDARCFPRLRVQWTGSCETAPIRGLRCEQPRCRDRKSTRLNSSHANISYAVFCLKKKKT